MNNNQILQSCIAFDHGSSVARQFAGFYEGEEFNQSALRDIRQTLSEIARGGNDMAAAAKRALEDLEFARAEGD